MEDLSYFILMSSLTFDLEEPGAAPEEAPGETSEEAPGEEPGETSEEEPEEEAADVNYITTVSENNISQIDLNKNTIDVFLIAAVLGAVLGFIFLQRVKCV